MRASKLVFWGAGLIVGCGGEPLESGEEALGERSDAVILEEAGIVEPSATGASCAQRWDELDASADSPTWVVAAPDRPEEQVRSWIGHSTCAGCGDSKTQRVQVDGLTPCNRYRLHVHVAYASTRAPFYATVVGPADLPGSATVRSGMAFSAPATGCSAAGTTWVVEFVANAETATLELGSRRSTGSHYLYLDALRVERVSSGPADAFREVSELVTTGTLDKTGNAAASAEFTSGAPAPVHVAGSADLSDVRPWIGHSTVAAGSPKKQRLTLSDLETCRRYDLVVRPSYVSSTVPYTATVASGQADFVPGTQSFAASAAGAQDAATSVWKIGFVPRSSEVTLEIGNAATSGANYMYVDAYESDKPFDREAMILLAKSKAGGYHPESFLTYVAPTPATIANETAHRNQWLVGYAMAGYNSMYRVTKDSAWLRRLVRGGVRVLSLRDSEYPALRADDPRRALWGTDPKDYRGEYAPAWRDTKNGYSYAWAGYTGQLFYPMLRFARFVAENPALENELDDEGVTFGARAREFAAAFDAALAYHDARQWPRLPGSQVGSANLGCGADDQINRGYHLFEADHPLPADHLRCTALPVNMQATLSSAMMERAAYAELRASRLPAAAAAAEDALATSLQDRVRRFSAALLDPNGVYQIRTKPTPGGDGDAYYWKYSEAQVYVDDVGHTTPIAAFAALAHENQLGIDDVAAARFGRTPRLFLAPDYVLAWHRIDGTQAATQKQIEDTATHQWPLIARTRPGSWDYAIGSLRRRGMPFVSLAPALEASPVPLESR